MVGDDTSDEPMYTSVLDYLGSGAGSGTSGDSPEADPSERFDDVFTCTVGRKPTAAQYFVSNTKQVVDTLCALADAD